ncbi:uncharacterized protein PHALS_00858 [Plasmopara halstedii]|uniref:Uncharacterized protein n=1 Tax=Plasmopara halstedii TaxID=4781 RepID=A0A0P1ATU1_PLAHL|nr:uncharacterized protein PHALS_00858 [Plasmopara halstedii]CEG44498.1 hypothetical protein PHALS_00858 [Plasmopara halstedii]|eukprot:XP_024580867.1 hypothetical protein PHALS_00858 [Plasmopara halstedii]
MAKGKATADLSQLQQTKLWSLAILQRPSRLQAFCHPNRIHMSARVIYTS